MYDQASNTNIIMLLNTAIHPFIVALITSFIVSRLARGASLLGGFAGFAVGLGLVHPGLSFPPNQAIDYYSMCILIAIIAWGCLTLGKASAALNVVVLALFSGSFYLLLNPVLTHSGMVVSLSWAVACGLTVSFYYLILNKTKNSETFQAEGQRRFYKQLPFIGFVMVAGGAAPVVAIGGSLLIGQLLGVFSAALSGYLVINYFTQALNDKTSNAAQSAALLLILGGLLTQSHVLADIPLYVTLMFVANAFVTPIIMALSNKLKHILIGQLMFTVATSGLSLWLVWPAGSLY